MLSVRPSQIKPPRFYDVKEEFPKYWAISEMLVHENKSLSIVEKMLQLKDSLKARAEMSMKVIQLLPQN